MMRAVLLTFLILCLLPQPMAQAQGVNRPVSENTIGPASPTREIAAALFNQAGPLALQRQEDAVPGWSVSGPAGALGYVASTWEVGPST